MVVLVLIMGDAAGPRLNAAPQESRLTKGEEEARTIEAERRKDSEVEVVCLYIMKDSCVNVNK
jgi:hypothetical protein